MKRTAFERALRPACLEIGCYRIHQKCDMKAGYYPMCATFRKGWRAALREAERATCTRCEQCDTRRGCVYRDILRDLAKEAK
jgi:hypothetical protein